MDIYSFILIICEVLKHRNRSSFKLIRIINHIKYVCLSWLENLIIKQVPLSSLKLNINKREEIIIASLTTYPARIYASYYAIKSIFLQTQKPDRIVLWLAESQFPRNKIPLIFNDLIEKGLEVRYCDDLRSHKKYYYALQEQRDGELVITFDDDIIYNPKTIERAYNKHLQYPNSIIANDLYVIRISSDNSSIMPYTSWRHPVGKNKKPDIYKYSLLTGSGCLYPINALPKEAFNKALLTELALSADDLWISFMAKLNHTSVVPVDVLAKVYTTIINSQSEHLAQINTLGTGNDDTIIRLLNHYPTIKDGILAKI